MMKDKRKRRALRSYCFLNYMFDIYIYTYIYIFAIAFRIKQFHPSYYEENDQIF